VRWKTFTFLCSKFIQETTRQISSEWPEFYRRYYEKQFGLIFSGHTVAVVAAAAAAVDCCCYDPFM